MMHMSVAPLKKGARRERDAFYSNFPTLPRKIFDFSGVFLSFYYAFTWNLPCVSLMSPVRFPNVSRGLPSFEIHYTAHSQKFVDTSTTMWYNEPNNFPEVQTHDK